MAPQVLLNHQRLLSRWRLLCVSEHRAVLGSGGGCSRPQHSDEPLLGRQLEVGGWWHAGTHLLLAAGPVGALCLPLLTQFSQQQHQPHGQKHGGQEGEDHNNGSDGLLRQGPIGARARGRGCNGAVLIYVGVQCCGEGVGREDKLILIYPSHPGTTAPPLGIPQLGPCLSPSSVLVETVGTLHAGAGLVVSAPLATPKLGKAQQ